MSKIRHTIKTDLDFDRSKFALTQASKVYASRYPQYSPEFEWVKDAMAKFVFNVKGFIIKGHILVQDSILGIEMDVPLLALAFKDQAINLIESEIKIWVDKIKNISSNEENNK